MHKISTGHYIYNVDSYINGAPPPRIANRTIYPNKKMIKEHRVVDYSDREMNVIKDSVQINGDYDSRLISDSDQSPDSGRRLDDFEDTSSCESFCSTVDHDHDEQNTAEKCCACALDRLIMMQKGLEAANEELGRAATGLARYNSDEKQGNDQIKKKSKSTCSSSLMSLLQKERMECGKSSPWVPINRRSKSEKATKSNLNRSILSESKRGPSMEAPVSSKGRRTMGQYMEEDMASVKPAAGEGHMSKRSISTRSGVRVRAGTNCEIVDDDEDMFWVDMPAGLSLSSTVAKTGLPLVTMSTHPYADFCVSLFEMGCHVILAAAPGHLAAELEELLFCYLALNPPSLSRLIRRAFAHAIAQLLRIPAHFP